MKDLCVMNGSKINNCVSNRQCGMRSAFYFGVRARSLNALFETSGVVFYLFDRPICCLWYRCATSIFYGTGLIFSIYFVNFASYKNIANCCYRLAVRSLFDSRAY